MNFVVLLLMSSLALTDGQIADVQNVKVTPKVQSESTAAILTWEAPSNVGATPANEITYVVKVCEINSKNCKESPKISETRYVFTGLRVKFLYSYHITAYAKDGTKSKEVAEVFRTSARNTCASNRYTCKEAAGCIHPRRKCDGIINCRDGSDENGDAGCTKPSGIPSQVLIEEVKDTSFVLKFQRVHAQDRATGYDIEILNTVTTEKIMKTEGHSNFGVPQRVQEINDLTPGTLYKVRVRALNRVGAGLWSGYVDATTTGRAPATTPVGNDGNAKTTSKPTTLTNLKVLNVLISPKPLHESTAFVLIWDKPANLEGNNEADLKYNVKYCEINKKETCKETPLSPNKKAEIVGLKPKHIYSYHINIYDKDNVKGVEYTEVYVTKSGTSCLPNQFTCKKSGECVLSNRRCDGLPNCRDGTDEGADAGCTAPSQRPSGLTIESVTSNSFTIKFNQVGPQNRANGYDIEIVNKASNAKRMEKETHNTFGAPLKNVTIKGLSGSTEYKIRVRAMNRVGAGLWSDYVEGKTSEGASTGDEGGLLKPTNVERKPKTYAETTAITISWNTPLELGENSESDLKYLVEYCEINKKETCKKTKIFTTKTVDITGLKKDFLYSYHIFAFGKDNKPGTPYESTFRTKQKRSCLPSMFTCTSADGCVEPKKLCDGLINCADQSDEGKDAKCEAPLSIVTQISVEEITGVSFIYKFRQVGAPERATEYEIEVMDTTTETSRKIRENHQAFGVFFKEKLISGLNPMRKYKIRTRANNRVGSGPWSDYKEVETKGSSTVNTVKAIPGESTVRLSWEAPTNLNGANAGALEYVIKYCRVKDNVKAECKEIMTKQKFQTVRQLNSGSSYEYEVITLSGGKPASAPYKSSFKTSGQATDGGSPTAGKTDEQSGMSTAQKIGIAVGIVLCLIILIIAIIACCKMRKGNKKGQARQSNGKQNGGYEMDRKA